jgi:hypothetical protein
MSEMNDKQPGKIAEAKGQFVTDRKMHKWAGGGVSSYPLSHPIVGQTSFFDQFEHFIHLVDDESERFAHVFAIIAQWGIGKSRLAYELMSQINDTSPGWYVRDRVGDLKKAELFRDDADRDQYLGLYLRYSQVATESHNIDNWFGFGLYKALLPLTRGTFNTSIQGQIAKEAYDRLLVRGFDEKRLAAALEIDKEHSDEDLYEDDDLVTRLCQAAYDYLKTLGINYVLIALDELETAAESATYGLETEAEKALDGRAIKLIGKAIKEEDPRGKLPFLRYVALCSPAIGQELREIRSTARRFELVELSQNAFADVSDFVQLLRKDGLLANEYPTGLVEAAYAMSGGNFGWFNVVMANIDQIIEGRQLRQSARKTKEAPEPNDVGSLFDEAVRVSSRIRDHVLDRQAVANLEIPREDLGLARELLYGQLPVRLDRWEEAKRESLLNATNEFGAPIAMLFQKVQWSAQACGKALQKNKFKRVASSNQWTLVGVEEPLDLTQLLANLGTYSIHETTGVSGDQLTLLVPMNSSQFAQLASILYPHPAVEDAARAIWRDQIGDDSVPQEKGTHLGPSIDMLNRLNLRLKASGATSFIFRDADESAAHEGALSLCKELSSEEKSRMTLTGIMRLLDQNWSYDHVETGLKCKAVTIATKRRATNNSELVTCHQLHLHPDGKVILAWVRSDAELLDLCAKVSSARRDMGRVPVVAFTPQRHTWEKFQNPADETLKAAHEYLMLYEISAREEQQLFPIGLPSEMSVNFAYHPSQFTSAFSSRLQITLRSILDAIKSWRLKLNERGRIAWPLKNSGVLQPADRDKLFEAYRVLLIESKSPKQLIELDTVSELSASEVRSLLERMAVSTKARSLDYSDDERCGLFSTLDDHAVPQVPTFLLRLYKHLLQVGSTWTFEQAKEEWFWGHALEAGRAKDTFTHWMSLLVELGLAEEVGEDATSRSTKYQLVARSALQNEMVEAKNWLNIAYPKIVERMKGVFGSGRVSEGFAPPNSSQVGTKTSNAQMRLQACADALVKLEDNETRWNDATTPEERIERFIASTRARLECRRNALFVYDDDRYSELPTYESIKQLSFDNDKAPLWQRIGQADAFVNFVLNSQKRIEERAEEVADEMRTGAEAGFPVSIFTRSLAKIENILRGSIGEDPAEGDTQKEQFLTPGTLGHALRDLKVSQASERLEQLAREVGCDLHSDRNLPLEEIQGNIATGYRNLLKAYEVEKERLTLCKKQIGHLAKVLGDVPSDFKYPESAPEFATLQSRPTTIERSLETSLDDDVDELITIHEKACRIGNFSPLMEQAKDLLRESKSALGGLAGHLTTLGNVVNGYRSDLLQDPELQRMERAYAALQRGLGMTATPPLKLSDLESAATLADAKRKVEQRRKTLLDSSQPSLAGLPIDFDKWSKMVEDLESGRSPSIDPQTASALVEKGLIQVTYRLGGSQ